MYKSNYGNSLLSLSEGYKLIARYNRKYGSVEIADLDKSIWVGQTMTLVEVHQIRYSHSYVIHYMIEHYYRS